MGIVADVYSRPKEPAKPKYISTNYANQHDLRYWHKFDQRDEDWRNGAVVYQLIVDRFAPSADLDAKRNLYPHPKKLRDWSESPQRGEYLDNYDVWEQELDFWGGDLASTCSRMDYFSHLDIDVLYLCPIHLAWTNHGYDAIDYKIVRPEYGTRGDVVKLAGDLHANGMRLVLDGVFNHYGRNSDIFRKAQKGEAAIGWFDFDSKLPGGARAWANAQNLPELVLENQAVAQHIWATPDSVVRSYIRDGVDGWRLDVAHDIGMYFLNKITQASHLERADTLTVGEVPNYPAEWFPELDGVMQFTIREILVRLAQRKISTAHAQRILARIYHDANYEHMLKSWIYLDNHDTPRIATEVSDPENRKLITVLQYSLPGSVNIYYGSELGMTGGRDPENRAPMRWDLVNDDNPTLALHRCLIGLRRDNRALRIGDLRWLETEKLIGFERHTDRVSEAVFVIANPNDEQVEELVLLPDSKIMDFSELVDQLSGRSFTVARALVEVSLAPGEVLMLKPQVAPRAGYTPYKRVR